MIDLLCCTYVEYFYRKSDKLLLIAIPLHPRRRETLVTRVAPLPRSTITQCYCVINAGSSFPGRIAIYFLLITLSFSSLSCKWYKSPKSPKYSSRRA